MYRLIVWLSIYISVFILKQTHPLLYKRVTAQFVCILKHDSSMIDPRSVGTINGIKSMMVNVDRSLQVQEVYRLEEQEKPRKQSMKKNYGDVTVFGQKRK